MVSITWKKVTGSVSIPLEERGSRRRNNSASCRASSRAAGRRRSLSISLAAAATIGRTASARAIMRGSPVRVEEAALGIALGHPLGADTGNERGRRRELPVDLFDRLAPGFQPEEVIDRAGHQEPAAEIKEGQRDLRQRHIRLEIVAGADDQREPDRADDLADAAETIGRAHAGGPQMRGPDLRRIGT